MRGWGVVLLIIGVGSFILPQFGFQFKLVSLFGPASGFIFGGVGLVLLILSFVMKKEAPTTSQGPAK
jgi:hypothetical protein